MKPAKEEKQKIKNTMKTFKNLPKHIRTDGLSGFLDVFCLTSGISQRRLGIMLGYSGSGAINQIINGVKTADGKRVVHMSLEKKLLLSNLLGFNGSEKLALLEAG